MYRARSLQSTEGQGFPSRLKARILVRPLRILRQRGRGPCSLFFRCGIRVSRLARGSYLTNQTTFSYGTKISSLRAFLPFFPFFFLSPLIPFHVLSFVPSRTFSFFSFLLSTRCSIFLSLDFSEKLQRISSKICNVI